MKVYFYPEREIRRKNRTKPGRLRSVRGKNHSFSEAFPALFFILHDSVEKYNCFCGKPVCIFHFAPQNAEGVGGAVLRRALFWRKPGHPQYVGAFFGQIQVDFGLFYKKFTKGYKMYAEKSDRNGQLFT